MAGLFALILAQLNCALFTKQGIHTFDFPKLLLVKTMTDFHSFNPAILFSGLVLMSVWVYDFLIIIHVQMHNVSVCLYHYNTIV